MFEAGIPLRHLETNTPAPVYVTSLQCRPAGKFSGPLVVSMRPIAAGLVARTVQVTSRYPGATARPSTSAISRA